MDKKIFILHDTHDTIYNIDGKNNYFYFENPDSAITFLKNQLLSKLGLNNHDYDNARILVVPLPTENKLLYWKIEAEEIKSKLAFKMPLPETINDYVLNERYVLYYDGNTTRTFVIDVKKIM